MNERSERLRRAILWDALLLLALAAYELCARLDAMWGPLKMFVHMAIGEKIPLSRAVMYVDFGIFQMPCFMLLCMALAVWALFARRSRRGCGVLTVFVLALAAVGFGMRLTLFGGVTQMIKLLPLVLLGVLTLARVLCSPKRKAQMEEAAHPAQTAPGTRFAPRGEQTQERARRFAPRSVQTDCLEQPLIAQQTAQYHRRRRRRAS